MMELTLDLDFACCTCGSLMGVTLKCAGNGLAGKAHAVAAVKVPCPHCSGINELYFEPSGTIHAVTPCGTRRVPEPSLN
jgi:phage FluMu protein Com